MQKKMLKNEKGAITLFVLLAILFFLIVIFSIFINTSNKKQSQTSQIDKIKSEYEKEIDNIDEIYDDVASKELIQVAFDENGGTYNIAKDGTIDISSDISITYEEGMNITSREYGWSNSSERQPSSWTSFANDTISVKNEDLGQGSYYLWVRVKNNKDITNTIASNVFQVNENEIGLSKNNDGYTTGSVIVTIDYKDTYVTNKKVGIGRTVDDAMKNAVANENTTVEVTENCFVYVTAEDAYGNTSSNYIEINNIDTEAPIITLTPNGEEYVVRDDETMQINVGVSVEDKISGVKEVKYYWSTSNTEKPSDDQYTVTANNATIPSEQLGEGTYYLWIKATDNAGNVREEPSYAYVVRPPLAPEVSLKENDANGETYTSGTWTNQDVYHEISLPTSEGTVEKYQYSNDGSTWEDIDGELKQGELNYTTNFPMASENKPEWLGELTANGTYYFDIDETTGTLTSAGEHGNKGKNSTTANSYIPIDLSSYSEDDSLTITLNYTISSESVSYDIGYATITETTNAPAYNSSTNQFINVGGSLTTSEKSITISGGKVYYLHLGYRKDSSISSGNDSFVINSITLTSETLGKKVNFYNYNKTENTITYTLQDEINKVFYIKAIYEDGTESGISQYRIQIDKTAPTIGNISTELTSQTSIKLTVSDIIERDSGLKGYYISTEETAPTVDSNWTSATHNTFEIENLNTNTQYYIWLIDNANNISEMTTIDEINANYRIDNSKYTVTLEEALSLANNNSTIELLNDYTDSSTATIDKNIILNTGNYTLTRTQTITINGGSEETPITFELNGKVTSSSNIDTLTTNNYVTIQGTGTIESTTASSSIYNTGTLTQDGELTVSGYYRGIYNTNTFTLNSGKVESTYNSSSAYAIYNYSSGDIVNVNGGEVSGYYGLYNGSSSTANIAGGNIKGTGSYGIYHSSGTLSINDGTITGNTYGVYASSSGTINVDGGYISGTNGVYVSSSSATINVLGGTVVGSTYGIYGYTTGDRKITIGDVNTEVNQTTPVISGGQYGIYMRNNNSYNFYNGIIMGTNTKPYTDTVNPREGYMVYTYYDYNNARKYCSVLTPTVDEITIEQTPANDIWTNQDVIVQVKYPILEGSTLQYSENGQDWKDVDNGYTTTISENKKVYARMLDASGIIIQSAEHDVTNIDKIAPTVTIDPETTKYTIYNMDQTDVDITVTVNVSDEGGSQIKTSKYGWSESKDVEPTQWEDLSNGQTIIRENSTVGTYYLWFDISDNAGNTSDVDVIRYIVELQEAVAKIVETGEYYYTIQEAIEAAGTTSATIQIIKDTDEVSTIGEGQNITIDLNGYTLGSSTSEQATITNNGTLTIIDNSESKTGTIENFVGTAIENNGTLTIGDNTNAIEDNTPTISGKETGIKNNNTLNYYDGTIIGKITIDGNVQSTPESYGPVGTYRQEDGMTVVNLRVISDYVARIEWFYYSTLQSAFDDCNTRENNTEQTTVHMLRDIILTDTVTTYMGQNICLNLNGYMLTNSKNTVLNIVADSKLEITDLTEEQNGNITSSVEGSSSISNYYKMITNNGNLNVSKGTILSEQNDNYPLYNENGTVEITGGMISGNDYATIYNNSTGTINVTGGAVGSNSSSSTVYGIYNNSTGTINVTGGMISSNSDGIYNNSGTINITGGMISSNSDGIYNNSGTINITGGTVNSNSNSSNARGIYNKTGTINVEEGTISSHSDNYDAYGIYNNTGTINVEEGTISSHSDNSNAYGIYNSGTGTINVAGGMISSSYYAIYNNSTGTINITGGTVNSNSNSDNYYAAYGIYNRGSGTINITGGTVNSNSNSDNSDAYGIYNRGSGTINITGGTINVEEGTISSHSDDSNAYGICNSGTGMINMTGGTIRSNGSSSPVYGICNNGEGTITIGIKNDDIVSNIEPNIVSICPQNSTNCETYGIYNSLNGTIYFYDGIIQAKNIIIGSGITEIQNNYEIAEDEQNGYKRVYLVEQNIDNYIIENIKTAKQYTTIREAINESTEETNELKVLKDFTLTTEFIVTENKNVTLNLNGKKVTNKYFKISNYGELEINDTTGNGKIENTENTIFNSDNASINIAGGTISSNRNNTKSQLNLNSLESDVYGIYNRGSGTIDMTGGTVSSNGNEYIHYSYGIYNNGSGTVNIAGGTVSSNNLKNDSVGIYNRESGTINMTGGIVYSISSSSTDRVYTANGIINLSRGIVNITGGEVKATNTGHAKGISNSGILNISEGEITINVISSSVSRISSAAISNSGTTNIMDGVINANNNSTGSTYGIDNLGNGTVNIKGGKINSINSSNYADNVYGANNSSTGIITIGTKGDGIVSTNEPSINATYTGTSTSSSAYGIYNPKGTFNFYDGRIEGSTKAIYEGSEITDVEEIQQPQYSEDETIYAYGLEASDIARIGTTTYASLQDAINKATETDVIEILRGIQYTNQDVTLTIPSDKNITIDLQNHPIVSAIEDAVFTIEGELKVINTVEGENAKITSSYEKTIYVKRDGTLEINSGTITNNKSENNVIENAGTVNIIGGSISQSDTTGYAINNIDTGTVNISSSTINGNICNTGKIEAIDSEFKGIVTNLNSGKMNITDSEVTGNITNSGNLSIINSTITGSNIAITNTGSGKLNIESGTMTTTDFYSTVIRNQENANIHMSGGQISVSSYYTQSGINNTSTGNINITGGNISAVTTGTSTSNKAYGIYSTAGTINIGTKDGNISDENLSILGTTNGIYTNKDCTLNVYDGIIKGKESAISGNITSIEEQSEIVVGEETNEDNVYETVSLVKVDSPIASVGDTEYYSLKEAFDSITGAETVNVLRTGTVAETINISSDKNVTIDLNGNTLNMYTNFNNSGTLKITDTSTNSSGVLTGYKDKVIDNTGTFELLGGTISEMTYGVYNNNGGTTNISGGTLTDNEYGVYNVTGGTVNVTNGNVTGNTYGIFNYGGEINVSGGNITGNEYGIYNSSGTTNISDLTITGNTTEVCNGGNGTINILNGNIISNTIAVTNTSSGRINIGSQDANVDKENPVIQGEQYGIANSGAGPIAFYDGIIKGKEGSIQGYYLYTETGYKAQTNIVDGYYSDTLALSGTVTTVAKIGEIEYTNLQSAINACTTDTPITITLVNSINSNNMFTIEEGQNIIIDLNGYTITTSTVDKLIENAGTLTIIDSSDKQTGKISNTSGVAINNTGTLNLGQDDGRVSTTCPEVSGKNTGIVNTGTFNFYDGIIKGAEALRGNVTARPSGYVINSSTDQVTGMNQLVLGR